MSEIYRCTCGYTYRIHRKDGQHRKRGHRKKMWCPLCRAPRNMTKL